MFCQAFECPAAVYNIENGQANRSAMERPHSEEPPTSSRCPLYQVSGLDHGGDHRH